MSVIKSPGINGENINSTEFLEQLSPAVSAATPLTGGSVSGIAEKDETHYVTPAGTIATLTWNLPTVANSRVGQVKMFLSTQNITTLTVTVLGGGTKVGSTLSAAYSNEAYAYQCISISGAGTWLRIS